VPADLHFLPNFRDRVSYLYVEHAVIEREDSAIAIFDERGMVQAPTADIALLMLGPGSKISHAAVDVLARDSCLVAWVAEEGVRLYAFGTGGTHSSARLLRQARMVCDPRTCLQTVVRLYQMRFDEPISPEMSIEQMRGKEGIRVRSAYERLARLHGIEWQGRNYDRMKWVGTDPANLALSAANACLYGVCHAAILGMGFSPALGFIHTGKQLSFVYDVADLYKLELSVPIAFEEAARGSLELERRVRRAMRDRFRETQFLGRISQDLLAIFGPDEEDAEHYDGDPALPGPLYSSLPEEDG
jgi:CRISPR-associated protein Cas1